MTTRREFIKLGGASAAALYMSSKFRWLQKAYAQIAGGTLLPGDVPKFVCPLVKPPAMPGKFSKNKDKYKIAMRQFTQEILPPGHPAFTIEAGWNKTIQVQWRNELVDAMGNYLPHILPVDQTLHWANPAGGLAGRDGHGTNQAPYTGPVPMITHVHGAHALEQFDGFAEAWYLPNAANIPPGYATTGTFYDYFNLKYAENWSPGTATFRYLNDQPASTLWYHDHSLGMTRLNVYAGRLLAGPRRAKR